MIIGCTAFGLPIEPADTTPPVIDTMEVHVEAALHLALQRITKLIDTFAGSNG